MNTLSITQTAPLFSFAKLAENTARFSKAIFTSLNPVRALRAYEQYSKFRNLDAKALNDMAISPLNVKETTVVDFFYGPSSKS